MLLNTTRRVHIAKSFTWRVLASLTTFLISWLVTGEIFIGVLIGGTEAIVKIFVYYGHERAWFTFMKRKGIVE